MAQGLQEFVDWLAREGHVDRVSPGALLVERFRSSEFDPPVRIAVTAASFQRLLAAMAPAAAVAFPDVEPGPAAFRLLTAHVEELLVGDDGARSIVLDGPTARIERLVPVHLPAEPVSRGLRRRRRRRR